MYLIDLGSRHGTHILHPGDTISRMLDPEVVTMLGDGDIVTFGKSVGKGSYVVPPVTVRVELLFGGAEKCATTSTSNVNRTSIVAPEMSRRSSSGRYGLFVPSSLSSPASSHSSDDELSSKYDHDSDIEEIAPPTSLSHRDSHNVFPLSLPALPNLRGLAESHFFGPDCSEFHTFSFTSLDDVRLPALDRPPEQSRSHSPMELSSPTPTPVGAWPSLSTPSPSVEQEKEVFSDRASKGSSECEGKEGLKSDARASQSLFGSAPAQAASDIMRSNNEDRSIPPFRQGSSSSASQSPAPLSELDLQGRDNKSEAQDKMVELNATISQMKVSTMYATYTLTCL